MDVAFRTDASLQIGTGHVIRCLTLADELRRRGANCHFIAREHEGHLGDVIKAKGFSVHMMPRDSSFKSSEPNIYANWLGTNWQDDATVTKAILDIHSANWLIVDHYALDSAWENTVRRHGLKIMVIDDVANRLHACDLLLDQNLGHNKDNYVHLVPKACQLLIGPHFALLRPEFKALRAYSLKRRSEAELKSILISMGGVDLPDAATTVLKTLHNCDLPLDLTITVIVGTNAPWVDHVKAAARSLPWNVDIVVNANDMAQRLSDCDLAIGAAGSSSWERCCLGVPSILVVTADNQRNLAEALAISLAAMVIRNTDQIESQLPTFIRSFTEAQNGIAMSRRCASLTIGTGTTLVADQLWK
jgi:UDP-2,4-diacetamido-2,4,6-trideoxy-beta-L-altropyranose hydrolase